MRDFFVTAIVAGLVPVALFHPFVGVALWTWLSVMSPHRLTWGFAYNLPFAQAAAIATLLGVVISIKKVRFVVTPITLLLIAFLVWITVSLFFALHYDLSVEPWSRVAKTLLMTLVASAVVRSESQIRIFVIIMVGSVAFFSVKGGIFTILTGGQYRVWGPPNSWIEENNALSVGSVMLVPLLIYLFQQYRHWAIRCGAVAATLLTIASILGSHSRGALVAISAMLAALAIKGRHSLVALVSILVAFPLMLLAMPEKWWDRMATITDSNVDASVQARLNAWKMAWNLALDRPLTGAGFAAWEPDIYARYGGESYAIVSSHSTYFQLLAEQGFVGLAIYLVLAVVAWRTANRIIRASSSAETLWRANLAKAVQVSMVGLFAGGLTVHMTYWDVYFYELVVLIALHQLVVAETAADRLPEATPSRVLHSPPSSPVEAKVADRGTMA